MGGAKSGRKKAPNKRASAHQPVAEGSGTTKRTKRHLADPHAGADMYILEDILAMRLSAGVREYLIRWKGYGEAADTYEPIENLAGSEDYIARFHKEQDLKNAEVSPLSGPSYALRTATPGQCRLLDS